MKRMEDDTCLKTMGKKSIHVIFEERPTHICVTKLSPISSDKMKHFLTYDFTPDPFQKRENFSAFLSV